jgi:hypothetical protein
MSAAACLGLGLKGDTSFEVGAKDAWEMVGHMLDCVDFHFVTEITEGAFNAYRNYAFAAFAADLERSKAMEADTRAQIEWAKHKMGEFSGWLKKRLDEIPDIKSRILTRIGDRSLLRKAPPEALGCLLATVMHTREQKDFMVIRYILGSTVGNGEGSAKDLSGNHKLKWTLRFISEIQVPMVEGPLKETKKTEALQDGIRIIREFGAATGKWDGNVGQDPDDVFGKWFKLFLAENRI